MSYAYLPLEQHIRRDATPQLRMTYAQIEAVLGRPLPPSARNDRVKRQWWANTETHTQAKAWLANGRKAKLDVQTDTVTFNKVDDGIQPTLPTCSDDIVMPLAMLQPATLRLIDDFVEERGVDRAAALAELVNSAALRHRRESLAWFAANTKASGVTSADIIRADRDGR